jgi:transcriptional regulator with XRE-family HTH domain
MDTDRYDLMVRRKRLGLHQRDIARLIGSNRPADVSEVENGSGTMSEAAREALRVQVEHVLDQLEAQRSTTNVA